MTSTSYQTKPKSQGANEEKSTGLSVGHLGLEQENVFVNQRLAVEI
jgi:hypothetical protein